MSVALALIVLLPGLTFAQDFVTEGSITAGVRFADVSGRRQKFEELLNLRSGFRIHDFRWSGRAGQPSGFADSYTVSGYGFGGEPFTGTDLRVSRKDRYDVRVNYRQSYYYWDRNDQDIQPSGFQGLTNHHNFATVRRLGGADATIHATSSLHFGAEYQRAERGGDVLTSRTLEYFGAPSTFAGFLRANPYLVEGPIDEGSNRVAGRVSYSRRDWNFHYKAGYQRYVENLEMHNLFSGQRSINLDEATTANELLDVARWSETRRISAPFSEFSYNGGVVPRFKIRGGYLYYGHSGPAEIDAAFAGRSRTVNTSTIAPYDVTMSNRADVREPNHIIDQGFTVTLNGWARVHTDYRYSRFTMDNLVDFSSVDSAGAHTGEGTVEWREGIHTLDVAIEFAPLSRLVVRPGIRLLKRDVTVLHDNVADPLASRPSKIASPLLSIYYAPSPKLTIRGDLRNSTNGGPYTRISPRTDRSARWILRYAPLDRLSFEQALNLRNADYTTSDFSSRLRSSATILHYDFAEKVTLFGGFTYDSFLATADIQFVRGTAPLQTNWRDQTISRIWEAGIDTNPVERLEIRLSGNYVRTTGAGEISGEPPTFGPLRWPRVTGTVSWEAPRAGTFSLDLERAYYIEEILRGNNFSANILGIRWTREF